MRTVDPKTLAGLKDALGAERVDTSLVGREACARDLSTLAHLRYLAGVPASEAPPPGAAPDAEAGFALPALVLRPRDVEQVQAALRLCHEAGVPVVAFGAGSGVCGGTLAIRGGALLDLKGLDRIREIDTESQWVEVEAGVNLQLLEDALGRRGLTLAHHPSSITCSTIGGAIAARGAGQLSTRYGKIEDMVAGLEVVLADGTCVRTAAVPRAATGPDWNQLFTGSEGTLGVIVSATLRLQRLPAARIFQAYRFPSLKHALSFSRECLQRGARPAALRLYDPLDTLLVGRAGDGPPLPSTSDPEEAPLGREWPWSRVSLAGLREAVVSRLGEGAHALKQAGERALLARPVLANRLTGSLPGVGCLLLLSFEGEPELAQAEHALCARIALAEGGEDRGAQPAERWWNNRIAVSFKQSGVYAMGGFVDTMEVVSSWSRLLTLHEQVRAAIGQHALVMAHFSHAYLDGCSIYFTFAGLREGERDVLERYRAAWRDGLAASAACGGAISHHHGIGLLKGQALRESNEALHGHVFQPIKQALDPTNLLNPGKLGLP